MSSLVRRAVLIIGGIVAVWLTLLLILGFAFSSRQAEHTKQRLGESLQATVTIGDFDLALVRGRLAIDRLALRRDDAVGRLAIDVGSVRCELAPLGFAIFDHDCRELAIRDLRIEISTASLFKLKRPQKHRPIHADSIVIDNATLVFLPSAFMPNLGRIEITVEHAESHATVLRTPMSWLFSLDVLRAHFALPAGIKVHVSYRGGIMTVAGSLFGSAPVELPVKIPAADLAKDAHDEVQLLVRMARDIAKQLVAKRAEDYLRSKLIP